MKFADNYFQRYNSISPIFTANSCKDFNIVIVIPCFNEENVLKALYSLKKCYKTKKSVEVIVIINSGEKTEQKIIKQNRKSYKDIKADISKLNSEKLNFLVHIIEDLPEKFAGVGFARKIGMDEALCRFNEINKPDGIIIGFDADSTVEENYLTEIESYFDAHPKINACSIHFEHPIEGNEFSEDIYKGIINYELHLRYFVNSLRYIEFPYSYQTIGSGFAVKASVYAKLGGMNRKKAGEDFYFLQKIIPLGNYGEINTTRVIPSPRISDRVPFGTGAAIKKIIQNKQQEYSTYNFQAFTDLQIFFKNKSQYFKDNKRLIKMSEPITRFLEINNFENDLLKINQNSPNLKVFEKRFFDWFNAFRVIKFLNFAHDNYYEKIPVKTAVKTLLSKQQHTAEYFDSEKELLLFLRENDKKSILKMVKL